MDMDTTYESEIQLGLLFKSLAAAFARLDRTIDPVKEQQELREIAVKLQDGKALVRDFEKEARTDDMRPSELATRKKELLQELNGFMDMKKQHAVSVQNRIALIGSKGAPAEEPKHSRYDGTSTAQMIDRGKKDIASTDKSLLRSEKVVQDTIAIATTTAETLHKQTEQLERTLDNLDEIQFSLKKAKQVIRDITRGIATDKCIMTLTMLSILALIVLIVLKVFKVGQPNSQATNAIKDAAKKAGVAITGRRLMSRYRWDA